MGEVGKEKKQLVGGEIREVSSGCIKKRGTKRRQGKQRTEIHRERGGIQKEGSVFEKRQSDRRGRWIASYV